ncbi:MAG: alpha-glucosidase [Gammaproteobacteria bacterium]|nr:alpha-glucosidase [Gammaproteobacteria bacterium]
MSPLFRPGVLIALAAVTAIAAPTPSPAKQVPWWTHAVIYEIYPRSFQDSNGDGIGDLAGIRSRLGYLQRLGIDAIWITPTYPSPQVDFGYDISNYEAVDPQYGTLADMDRLLAAAKRMHIRVLLDMVLNHTSDQHPWFLAAASSRSNPMHDWYVWSDGKKGGGPDSHDGRIPPNNWVSLFGGSAWTWVPAVHQFYYHKFYRQQPDLNWRNPRVEKAMFAAMRFWLDRGVAGFRLDAIPQLFEDPRLRDERPLGGVNAQGDPVLDESKTSDLPEVHGVMRRLRRLIEAYPGHRVLIGETYLPSIRDLDAWYGGARHDELQLPMDMRLGFHGDHDHLDADAFRRRIEEAETEIHGSDPLFVFDNHDNVRSIDRYGDGAHDPLINKLLGSILLTTRATALMYYGEELGMRTTPPKRREDVKDPIGITGWPKEKGRDGERTPMQWTPGPQAGFSTNPHTWLPVPANHVTINVASESRDPESQLHWFKRLIALRREEPALRDGGITMLDAGDDQVLAYLRGGGAAGTVVVAMNCSASPRRIAIAHAGQGLARARIETLLTDAPSLRAASSLDGAELPPYATWIVRVERPTAGPAPVPQEAPRQAR